MCEKKIRLKSLSLSGTIRFLIHAKLGAFLAKDKYKVEDPEILSAITWHTTGKRKYDIAGEDHLYRRLYRTGTKQGTAPTRLRKLAFTDIDECMYEILKDSMAYLSENPKTMDPMTGTGKAGVHPKQIEGYQTANWILMDYGDVVIHIFDEENRLFYDLERIWRDGKVVEKEEIM